MNESRFANPTRPRPRRRPHGVDRPGLVRLGVIWLGAATLLAPPLSRERPTTVVAAEQAGPAVVETVILSEPLDGRGRIGGVAVDRLGFIYVSNFHDAVWRISPDGEVDTLSLALYGSSGNVIDSRGDLLQANFFANTIVRIARTGAITTVVTGGLDGPVGLAFADAGDLYVCNCRSNTIGRVSASELHAYAATELRGVGTTARTFATSELFGCPNGLTFDDDGNLYVVSFGNDFVVRVDPEGEASLLATLPSVGSSPAGNAHIVFAQGDLFVTRIRTNEIYRVTLSGEASRFAGTGEPGLTDGPALEATLAYPNGIAVGPDGATLYVNNIDGVWRGDQPAELVVRRIRLSADG